MNGGGHVLERPAGIDAFRARQVEIPLVDARALDHWRIPPKHRDDLSTLLDACLARDRHTHRLRTESKRTSDGHRRPNTVSTRFIRRRTDDSATAWRASDDEEGCATSAVGVGQARDSDEKRVGVGEKDA